MRPGDALSFAGRALRGHRVRTGLSLAGIAVGVAAVVLLTGLGEGARRYVTTELQSLGSGLVGVMPGKIETTGMAPIFGGSTRDLTLADARAVERRSRTLRWVTPVALGTGAVESGGRGRNLPVIGATPEYFLIHDITIGLGTGLPDTDYDQGARVAVIGRTVQRELFRDESPLGKVIRIAEHRFRVVGVIAPKGSVMGFDFDDLVFVPVATCMRMFDRTGLFRILTTVRSPTETQAAIDEITEILKERHDGDIDFTVVDPGTMMSALDQILLTLSLALTGIAAISLTVAGIGIMNVMLVSVTERTSEIGLMKALGASDGQVLLVFLVEAVMLTTAGGVLGTLVGFGGTVGLRLAIGSFDPTPPLWAVAAALGVAAGVGIVFGILPARRASKLDPVVALAKRK